MNKKIKFCAIVTKPQELLAILSLKEQKNNSDFTIIFVSCFTGSKKILDNIKIHLSPEIKIIGVEKYWEALNLAKRDDYDEIIIDGDVGFQRMKQLIKITRIINSPIISVYEEGVGVYRNDFYFGVKKFIFKLLGIGINFGGNILTKKIYVFDKNLYEKSVEKKPGSIEEIKTKIPTLYEKKYDILKKIFDLEKIEKKINQSKYNECDIYLTDWNIDSNAVKNLNNSKNLKIIKIHPRIKKEEFKEDIRNTTICPQQIPAELLIIDLSKKFSKVNVFHHGSTCAWYLKNLPGVNFININKKSNFNIL